MTRSSPSPMRDAFSVGRLIGTQEGSWWGSPPAPPWPPPWSWPSGRRTRAGPSLSCFRTPDPAICPHHFLNHKTSVPDSRRGRRRHTRRLSMKIYADNAATTKMCPAAIEAMLPFLDRIYGNPSSLHSRGAGGRRNPGRRQTAHRGLYQGPTPGDRIHFRRQRGGQPGDPLRRTAGAAAGQAAYHIHRIRASRCPAHPGEAEAGGL